VIPTNSFVRVDIASLTAVAGEAADYVRGEESDFPAHLGTNLFSEMLFPLAGFKKLTSVTSEDRYAGS
jgi:hypothetical protein